MGRSLLCIAGVAILRVTFEDLPSTTET